MAQTQIVTKKAQVHLVVEATENTYVAPANNGTGMFMCEINDSPMTLNSSNSQPNYTRSDYLAMDAKPGTVNATLQFRVPLAYSGTAGTAPKSDVVFLACGLKNVDTGTTNTYGPISTYTGAQSPASTFLPGASYSCSILESGIRYAISGAQGTFTISAEAGAIAYMDVTMHGAYVAVADDGLETATYDAGVAPAFLGATVSLGGTTRIGVSGFTLDLGNEIGYIVDANSATGFRGARIVGRKTTGTVTPEAVLVGTVDDFGIWRAGTSGNFNTGAVGPSAGYRWQVTCPQVVRGTPSLTDTDGIRHFDIPFTVGRPATYVEAVNPDFTIAFT